MDFGSELRIDLRSVQIRLPPHTRIYRRAIRTKAAQMRVSKPA